MGCLGVSAGPEFSLEFFHLKRIAGFDMNACITECLRRRQLPKQSARAGHNDLTGIGKQRCEGLHFRCGHLRTGGDCLNTERFIRAEKRAICLTQEGRQTFVQSLRAV